MKINLRIWRQRNTQVQGRLVEYTLDGVSGDMSFLEMLDLLNEQLTERGEDPVAFDSDCREGICGQCGVVINGVPHGGQGVAQPVRTTTCQLHMRSFADGSTITIEPWKAAAFPVLRDLVVDRTALDNVIAAGGYISVNTGAAPDAHAVQINKKRSDRSFDAATCIGCGACVAACPNGSSMLFTSAKITHLAMLPQGQPERVRRVKAMVAQQDAEGFGGCTNIGECASVCPKGIPLESISQLNRDLIASLFKHDGKDD
ncbi:succinate dehydrogenase/fumarate reductase iron-sulfur subunit [Acidipropionibacterium acidipropionici]|uniref:succinate dehydrogenase/fumarate reductase iron-sulfur subunit n=1 Tax=Acidipropionibacterium acidipropionici TaxID=1748 RepID=UPI00110A1377|nr:succinate dehydrogenase/fumarate reductase iron-sulfur subunit [Acidipropionibacterium acidipropionici]QCV94760.1 succinate dehydrogenase/fumarate reductase iron-sulfur subunit [Acidipropionibacterium acidipropionici]